MTYRDEQVEILVEERSMEVVLSNKLPEILPEGYALGINVFIRPHNGKQDLKKSIPKKVKVFSNFYRPAKIIVLQDQDSNDCIQLKSDLKSLCEAHGTCPVLIRIACRELENWYLGDMDAIEQAYPAFKASDHRTKQKYRNPDQTHGAAELAKLIPGFQKGNAARRIGPLLDVTRNQSPSFKQLVRGIRRFLG